MDEGKGKTARFTPILKTAHAEFFAVRPSRYGETQFPVGVGHHNTTAFDPRATFATSCIEKWGMVAAMVDGEDSSGRTRARVATPDEIVSRACDIAEKAYAEFERRGWAHAIPPISELIDKMKDTENGND